MPETRQIYSEVLLKDKSKRKYLKIQLDQFGLKIFKENGNKIYIKELKLSF